MCPCGISRIDELFIFFWIFIRHSLSLQRNSEDSRIVVYMTAVAQLVER